MTLNELQDRIQEFKTSFNDASKEFRYIQIDNFLEADFAEELLEHFPSLYEMATSYKAMNEFKSEESDLNSLGSSFEKLNRYMSSQEFTDFLSELTSIDDLKADDTRFGGGIHQGGPGSYLDIHVDFNLHPLNNTHRRLNVLIYLNKNWTEEKGGVLELWDGNVKHCLERILPVFNRCVIFETSEISYHGYAKVSCAENESRKSIASYYYTKERPLEEIVKKHTTTFKARPSESKIKYINTELRNKAANIYKRFVEKG